MVISTIESVYRLLGPSFRVSISNDEIIYNGLFVKHVIKTKDIEDIRTVKAPRFPKIWLCIKLKNKRSRYMLDISGLSPNYKSLLRILGLKKII